MPPVFDVPQLVDWIDAEAASTERYLFGIAGPPGCGKSTLSVHLAQSLDAVVVPMDGFHLPNDVLDQRGVREVKGAPHTFDATGFVEAVSALRSNRGDLLLADFDRTIDEPRADRIEVPQTQRIVVVEGNYLLLDTEPWDQLPELFDAIGYLDVDAALRVDRLIARHVEYGKSPEEAHAFVSSSDERNADVVSATRNRADLFVTATAAP